MDYKILYKKYKELYGASHSLEKEVKYYIKKGWAPIGGVSVSAEKYSYTVAQAMIKP